MSEQRILEQRSLVQEEGVALALQVYATEHQRTHTYRSMRTPGDISSSTPEDISGSITHTMRTFADVC
jgi:hypothetical protein